jgi:DNA-binding response OmpR family regulator
MFGKVREEARLKQPGARVLVVDDDADTCALLVDILVSEDYQVVTRSSAEEALDILMREPFDVVLSDIKMPGKTGMDLLRWVRRRGLNTEVILMTAYASVDTAVQALRREAFDYLTKPFSLNQIRQVVRDASRGGKQQPRRHAVEHYQDLSIDHRARRVWMEGKEVRLTRLEFDVLAFLFDNQGCAVSLDELLEEVWERNELTERSIATVRSCVRRLRQKINDDSREPRYIHNVWGVGYQFGE